MTRSPTGRDTITAPGGAPRACPRLSWNLAAGSRGRPRKAIRGEYFLYFATNSSHGLSKMKEVMWKTDPLGGEAFSDLTDARQMVLLDQATDLLPLQRLVQGRFRGRGWVDISEVERFVLEDTAYSETIHLRRRTLGEMEKVKPPSVEARRPPRKRDRPGEYPVGTRLRFG